MFTITGIRKTVPSQTTEYDVRARLFNRQFHF